MLTLYSYFRSSAAFRVRIALQLKALPHEVIPVHLLRNGGEQHSQEFQAVNPAAMVPALRTDAATLRQSLAILEFLDETYPAPPLLPADALGRARVRALALTIACDIHPLNNLRVLRYLQTQLQIDEERRNAWHRHWIVVGFAALERLLQSDAMTGRYCHGDAPTLADCCLVPQVFNARRLQVPLADYPTIARIHELCMQSEAFRRAAPDAQADAQ